MNKYKVILQSGEMKLDVFEGCTLMEAMNEGGWKVDFPCGGKGKCGKCRIRILKGLEQPTASELELLDAKELEEGIRLACLTKVHNDLICEFLEDKKLEHNILIAAGIRPFLIEPHFKKILIEVDKPSINDQRSDWHRVKDSLAQQGYSYSELETKVPLIRQLPDVLREAKFSLIAVMYGSQVLELEQQDTTGTMLGIAFDIGTTTIVGYLLDLYTGKELSVVSALNPQTTYGADVISRVMLASEKDGLNKLHAAVVEAINCLIVEATNKAGVNKRDIYAVSIAANTCMHHLFLGVNPRHIALAPYVPAISEPIVADPLELNIDINQAGKIFVLPNIAGFVGADTVAVLLATDLNKSNEIKLVIDIGTNGEIALGSRDKLFACSAAAGPAFEGAQISCGMRGAEGAIDHVYFKDKLEFFVIGGGDPKGVCGSALLDTVAGLLKLGMIDKRGKILLPDKLTNPKAKIFQDNLIEYDGLPAFLLAAGKITSHGRPIMITQRDIRELQMAKGAMAAGIWILIEACDIEIGDITEVLLAGAFGNYLNPHSACLIGLIPMELESKIKMIGNAAGIGAKLALLSSSEYHRAAEIAENVNFVELGSQPKFTRTFAECMYFNANQ
ncbi:MAG TPA: ASKHA domain-containing protein [Desulfosporosinus sp.]|nr:ASKHA domain-containing protein [Desulfosporosinus sp.]